QIPTGVLADTLGPRRVVTAGAGLAGIGSALFGLAPDLSVAVAGRVLVGLGVSVFFICLLKVAADSFSERRFATASGVAVFAGNVGAVLAGAPLAWLVLHGAWRAVFVAVGMLLLVLALAAWRHVPEPAARDPACSRPMDWRRALWGVARTAAIWPAVAAMMTAGATYSTFVALWAVPYLVQVRGMSAGVAAGHTSLALASFAVTSLVVGTVSDRLGRRRPILIGGLAINAVCWLAFLADRAMPLVVSYTLFAVLGAAATSFTLLWACAKDACPLQFAGMSTSMVNAGQFLGVGVLQPVFGWILDRGWQGASRDGMRLYSPADFHLGISVLLACTVAGLMFSFLIRESARGPNLAASRQP
ncbi:MAG: MFS transporter, partial [Betaproteobacteria bacterium]